MKNKGFTLLELIGVITLLGVIAIIIVPIVGKVVTRSKVKTDEMSIVSLVNVAKQSRTDNGYLQDITVTIDENRVYYLDGTNQINIKYEGAKPTSGTIFINDEGQYTVKVIMSGLCFTKELNGEIEHNTDLTGCN